MYVEKAITLLSYLSENSKRKANMAKKQSKKEAFLYELHASPAFNFKPLNKKQDLLVKSIASNPISIAIGSAGTGKTFCVTYLAAKMLMKGDVDKIVLTRANQPTGKSLGYFPGTLEEKMTPWLLPMLNNLKEAMGGGKYDCAMKNSIEMQPIETIRGQSFENAFVIIDEAQNLTYDEIKAVSTRLGRGSTMVFAGDPAQSDVKGGQGIERFIDVCRRHSIDLPVIRFSVEDIVRSDIVGQLCKAFELEESK